MRGRRARHRLAPPERQRHQRALGSDREKDWDVPAANGEEKQEKRPVRGVLFAHMYFIEKKVQGGRDASIGLRRGVVDSSRGFATHPWPPQI